MGTGGSKGKGASGAGIDKIEAKGGKKATKGLHKELQDLVMISQSGVK
eukprot:gene22530-21262_t